MTLEGCQEGLDDKCYYDLLDSSTSTTCSLESRVLPLPTTPTTEDDGFAMVSWVNRCGVWSLEWEMSGVLCGSDLAGKRLWRLDSILLPGVVILWRERLHVALILAGGIHWLHVAAWFGGMRNEHVSYGTYYHTHTIPYCNDSVSSIRNQFWCFQSKRNSSSRWWW